MSGTIEDFRPAFAAMGIDERRVDCVEVEPDEHPLPPYVPGGLTARQIAIPDPPGVTVRVRLRNGGEVSRRFAPGEVYARWQA